MTLRLAIVLVVLAALVAVQTSSRSGLAWRLITFTYQVNVLAALYYGWTLLRPLANPRTGLRGAVVLYVVVAGLVWNLVLTERSMGYTPANVLLHVVVPVLALADWLLVAGPAARPPWWQPLAWLGYPAVYAAVAVVVLDRAGRRAPYYFLDPAAIGGGGVALSVTVLGAGLLGLGYAIRGLYGLPLRRAAGAGRRVG